MKYFMLTAALSVAIVPNAFSDLAGPKTIPVQKPVEKKVVTGPVKVQLRGVTAVNVPQNIAGVSLGSPYIANVAVHDKNLILITGRAYGETSLHVMDDKGNIVVDTTIFVVNESQTKMTVNKGGSDYTMNCTPNCKAAPDVGDNVDYVTTVSEQITILAKED